MAVGALAGSGGGVPETILISRAGGAAGAVGDAESIFSSISPNGRYVAFASLAGNFDPDSDDTILDVFVRDRQANTTTLVNRASGAAGAVSDDNSFFSSISADGRYVAFDSAADNLDPDSDDGVVDVFVRDLQENTTTLVSRASGVSGDAGDGGSTAPSISADGQRVAFESGAGNLDPDSDDGVPDIFVRDLQAHTTTLVSRAGGASGALGDGDSGGHAISADGRYVAFDSDADNLDSASNDGVSDVFVRDLQANTTTLVSRATGVAGAVGDGGSFRASISGDGRQVAFHSVADNLDPDSNDAVTDVFVRDTQAAITSLASRASGFAGPAGDGSSTFPALSNVGSVAFQSDADNLDPDSNDTVPDVFVRELGDPSRCAGKLATKFGTAGRDRLRGTRRRDVIAGLGGNDVIQGLAGKDLLCGGRGRDRLRGGPGRDTLLGQAGRDSLSGGPGRDKLRGGPGRDRLVQ